MGVTIHFEGRIKDVDSLKDCLALARRFSEKHNWPVKSIDASRVVLQRVRDEQDCDYIGPVMGLEIYPHDDSEPIRLEFDKDLFVQEFTKTQFAPIEVHVQIVELMRRLAPFFENLRIEDEGEYFESGDLTALGNHRHRCQEVIDEYLAQPGRFQGPTRLESGRIVDLTERD